MRTFVTIRLRDACTADSAAFGSDPLWLAAYAPASPAPPSGWAGWTFWQFTSGATVPGIGSARGTDAVYGSVAGAG
jgi:GH25 family lysozyme M1 (1,4-beta-N-acetylmuramidase)